VDVTFTAALQNLQDSALFPRASATAKRCTIACPAEIVGVADLLRIESGAPPGAQSGFDVALLRLRVLRPDGEAEACVRQHVPPQARPALRPGFGVMALAHDSDPAIALVDWDATARALGHQLEWVVTAQQFKWPDADEWPARGAFEVRDKGRYERRLQERRATWTPAQATLQGGGTRGGLTDSRVVWKLELALPNGTTTISERVPSLAAAWLFETRVGAKRLGGLAETVETVARVGKRLDVLVSPTGEVAVDWPATLAQRADIRR
jgi:hypothetical protein